MTKEAPPEAAKAPRECTPEPGPPERSDGALAAVPRLEGTRADVLALVTEAEAYRIYGHLLEDKELRRARAAGRIGYLRRKRTIHYRRDELDTFVRMLVEEGFVPPCPTRPVPPLRPARLPPSSPTTEDTCRRVLAKLSREVPR